MTFRQLDDAELDIPSINPERAVAWNWRDLGAGVAGVLVLLFVLAVASYPLVDHYGEHTTGGRLTQAVVNGAWYLCSILFIYFIVRRRGASWRDLGLRVPAQRESRWFRLLGAIILILLAAYIAVIAYGILVQTLGLDFLEPDQQLPDDTYDSNLVVIRDGALVIFGAPLAEELLFRGFSSPSFACTCPSCSPRRSAAASSPAHGDPGPILPFTAVGVLLAYAYERTGTLWGSIGVHFCFNTITFRSSSSSRTHADAARNSARDHASP